MLKFRFFLVGIILCLFFSAKAQINFSPMPFKVAEEADYVAFQHKTKTYIVASSGIYTRSNGDWKVIATDMRLLLSDKVIRYDYKSKRVRITKVIDAKSNDKCVAIVTEVYIGLNRLYKVFLSCDDMKTWEEVLSFNQNQFSINQIEWEADKLYFTANNYSDGVTYYTKKDGLKKLSNLPSEYANGIYSNQSHSYLIYEAQLGNSNIFIYELYKILADNKYEEVLSLSTSNQGFYKFQPVRIKNALYTCSRSFQNQEDTVNYLYRKTDEQDGWELMAPPQFILNKAASEFPLIPELEMSFNCMGIKAIGDTLFVFSAIKNLDSAKVYTINSESTFWKSYSTWDAKANVRNLYLDQNALVIQDEALKYTVQHKNALSDSIKEIFSADYSSHKLLGEYLFKGDTVYTEKDTHFKIVQGGTNLFHEETPNAQYLKVNGNYIKLHSNTIINESYNYYQGDNSIDSIRISSVYLFNTQNNTWQVLSEKLYSFSRNFYGEIIKFKQTKDYWALCLVDKLIVNDKGECREVYLGERRLKLLDVNEKGIYYLDVYSDLNQIIDFMPIKLSSLTNVNPYVVYNGLRYKGDSLAYIYSDFAQGGVWFMNTNKTPTYTNGYHFADRTLVVQRENFDLFVETPLVNGRNFKINLHQHKDWGTLNELPTNLPGHFEPIGVELTNENRIIFVTKFSGVWKSNESIVDIISGVKDGLTFSQESQVVLYPNPANSSFSVKSDKLIKYLTLYNSLGQLIFKEKFSGQSFDVKSLKTGFYMVLVDLDNGEKIAKQLVVE